MRIRLGHLYPDYLNIYADRGNIAVFMRRAELRGHELAVRAIGIGDWLKSHQGWRLVEGTGRRAFVSPDDPRHPRNRPPP